MGLGAFAGGLASGIVTGTNLARSVARDKREEETAGLQRRALKAQVEDIERRSADDKAVRDAVQSASAPTWQGNGGDQVTTGSQQERMLAQQEGTFADPGSLATRQARIADGLNAGWQEALKRGDQANFEKYFGSWVGLRTKLRTEAVNKADAMFKLSNGQDLSGYVKAYNDFVDDGTKIKDIKPAQDGKSYQAVIDVGGKEMAQVIPREKIGEMLMTLRDPAAMAKREADMAMERFKASLKVDNIPEGGLAVRGDGTVVGRNPRERPVKDNFVTRKLPGEHAGEEVVDLRKVDQPGGAPGVPPEPRPGSNKEDRQFFKDHAPVLDDIRNRVDATLGDRVTDPVTGKLNYAPNDKSRAASAWAAGIYRNAVKRGEPLSPDVLTEIVTKGQQTDAKGNPIMAVIEDASTGKLYKAPAIVYQGQSYLSDAEPRPLSDEETTAWRNRGKGAAPKPAAGTDAAPKPAPKPAAKPTKDDAPGLRRPAERAAAEPTLVDEPALTKTPAERARAAREQSQQRIENERKARDDESKKQGARLSAYNFRNLISRGRYTKADKAAIQSAIDSGMLNERELQTAQGMLERIGGGGAVAEAR